MRIRYALGAAPLLLLSLIALAQPKRAARGPAPDAADKADAGGRADSKPGPVASTANVDSDIGGPPPKIGDSRESKLSPLNPEVDELPDGGAQTPPVNYDELLGDIATLRSRVSALTTTLFASKLRVVIETRAGDGRVASLGVTLDDGVVFTAPDRFVAEDEHTVYEHSVAPGHHVLGVDIERFDLLHHEYRSWQSSRFAIVVPENKLVDAHLIIQDGSDMGKDFSDGEDGEYDLRVRLRARVER